MAGNRIGMIVQEGRLERECSTKSLKHLVLHGWESLESDATRMSIGVYNIWINRNIAKKVEYRGHEICIETSSGIRCLFNRTGVDVFVHCDGVIKN